MATTRDYTDYLNDQVDIAPVNSQEELQASEIIESLFVQHGLETQVEEFDAPILASLSTRIYLILMFLGMLLSGIQGTPVAVVGLVLVAVAFVLIVLARNDNDVLASVGPQARSQNVIGVHRATGPNVIKGNRPIVIVAHYDTPRENFLFDRQFAKWQPIIKHIAWPLSIAVLVMTILQVIPFIPPIARRVIWVIGVLVALPLLLLGAASIYERFAPCTTGANDNKASVAAMLGVLDMVRPGPDDAKRWAATHPKSVRRSLEEELEDEIYGDSWDEDELEDEGGYGDAAGAYLDDEGYPYERSGAVEEPYGAEGSYAGEGAYADEEAYADEQPYAEEEAYEDEEAFVEEEPYADEGAYADDAYAAEDELEPVDEGYTEDVAAEEEYLDDEYFEDEEPRSSRAAYEPAAYTSAPADEYALESPKTIRRGVALLEDLQVLPETCEIVYENLIPRDEALDRLEGAADEVVDEAGELPEFLGQAGEVASGVGKTLLKWLFATRDGAQRIFDRIGDFFMSIRERFGANHNLPEIDKAERTHADDGAYEERYDEPTDDYRDSYGEAADDDYLDTYDESDVQQDDEIYLGSYGPAAEDEYDAYDEEPRDSHDQPVEEYRAAAAEPVEEDTYYEKVENSSEDYYGDVYRVSPTRPDEEDAYFEKVEGYTEDYYDDEDAYAPESSHPAAAVAEEAIAARVAPALAHDGYEAYADGAVEDEVPFDEVPYASEVPVEDEVPYFDDEPIDEAPYEPETHADDVTAVDDAYVEEEPVDDAAAAEAPNADEEYFDEASYAADEPVDVDQLPYEDSVEAADIFEEELSETAPSFDAYVPVDKYGAEDEAAEDTDVPLAEFEIIEDEEDESDFPRGFVAEADEVPADMPIAEETIENAIEEVVEETDADLFADQVYDEHISSESTGRLPRLVVPAVDELAEDEEIDAAADAQEAIDQLWAPSELAVEETAESEMDEPALVDEPVEVADTETPEVEQLDEPVEASAAPMGEVASAAGGVYTASTILRDAIESDLTEVELDEPIEDAYPAAAPITDTRDGRSASYIYEDEEVMAAPASQDWATPDDSGVMDTAPFEVQREKVIDTDTWGPYLDIVDAEYELLDDEPELIEDEGVPVEVVDVPSLGLGYEIPGLTPTDELFANVADETDSSVAAGFVAAQSSEDLLVEEPAFEPLTREQASVDTYVEEPVASGPAYAEAEPEPEPELAYAPAEPEPQFAVAEPEAVYTEPEPAYAAVEPEIEPISEESVRLWTPSEAMSVEEPEETFVAEAAPADESTSLAQPVDAVVPEVPAAAAAPAKLREDDAASILHDLFVTAPKREYVEEPQPVDVLHEMYATLPHIESEQPAVVEEAPAIEEISSEQAVGEEAAFESASSETFETEPVPEPVAESMTFAVDEAPESVDEPAEDLAHEEAPIEVAEPEELEPVDAQEALEPEQTAELESEAETGEEPEAALDEPADELSTEAETEAEAAPIEYRYVIPPMEDLYGIIDPMIDGTEAESEDLDEAVAEAERVAAEVEQAAAEAEAAAAEAERIAEEAERAAAEAEQAALEAEQAAAEAEQALAELDETEEEPLAEEGPQAEEEPQAAEEPLAEEGPQAEEELPEPEAAVDETSAYEPVLDDLDEPMPEEDLAAEEQIGAQEDVAQPEVGEDTAVSQIMDGLMFSAEEDPSEDEIADKDVTGLTTISEITVADVEDSMPVEENHIPKPRAVDDPDWGRTNFKPSTVSVGRRAMLLDLPDPSVMSVDPLDTYAAKSTSSRSNIGMKVPEVTVDTESRRRLDALRRVPSPLDDPSTRIPQVEEKPVAEVPAAQAPTQAAEEEQALPRYNKSKNIGSRSPKKNAKRKMRFGRRRKNEPEQVESMGEWLGLEDDYDAKKDGRQIGSWDNFDDDGRQGKWKGGATLRAGLRDDYEQPDDRSSYDSYDELASAPEDGQMPQGSEGGYDDETMTELREAVLRLGDDDLIAHDIWFVGVGASTLDHAGMRAFLDEHRRDIRGAFLVNIDSVGAGDLKVLTSEGMGNKRRADRRMVRMFSSIADALHIDLGRADYSWEETDATPAMQRSVRVNTLMGMSNDGVAAHSHTSIDEPEYLNDRQIANVADLIAELIRKS